MYPLRIEITQLNQSSGFTYRMMLAGMIAAHGKDAVIRELMGTYSGNVVSIAAAQNWCRSRSTSARIAAPWGAHF